MGNDALLMQTRTGLFAAAGLRILNLVGLEEALAAIHSAAWDAAILCHTLSREERSTIIGAIRRSNPRAPVLLVARRTFTAPGDAQDFDLILSAYPPKMIAALRELVQRISKEEGEQEEAAS
jgi:hypothetical protein